jgi:endogenous inhibitor of DNA gyrase (YacG/DUF329 family)
LTQLNQPQNAEKPCPICSKPSVAASRPFCSERCRDVDLNRWLSGSYAIPAADLEADDDEDSMPPPARGTSRSS